MTVASAPRTARERARLELTAEIKEVARRHVAEAGAEALSLRAVARELGMASSALYRYFPSKDELLTALIIDAYDAAGTAAEESESGVRRGDLAGRWLAAARAVRSWAIDNPQQYALIFGSPIAGYRAPQDTVDPGIRIPLLLVRILVDRGSTGPAERPIPKSVRADLKGIRKATGAEVADHQLARGLMAWTQLIGSISFELFGQFANGIFDYESYFDYQMRGVAADLRLV